MSDPALRVASRPRAPRGRSHLGSWCPCCSPERALPLAENRARKRGACWRMIVRTCTLAHPPAWRAGCMPAHRPQEHQDGEVLDVVVHTSIVHGCRLRTVVTIRPSRARVSSWARRRQCLGAARRPRVCQCGASGIDRACAQLLIWRLRDGRRCCPTHPMRMVEFD